MNSENHEGVAGNVSQNAFGDSDGGDIRKFACEQESGDEGNDASDGACDKLGEALAQVIVHDAEIWTRRFQKCVGDKADDSDGGNDCRIFRGVNCTRRNGIVNFFNGFFAEITATKEE